MNVINDVHVIVKILSCHCMIALGPLLGLNNCKVENRPRDHLVVPAMQSHDLQEASARVDVLGLCEEQIPEYHLSSAEMDAGCGLNSKA